MRRLLLRIRNFVALLMTIVALVLIVACANVGGILLAQAATRRQEIAVRSAMGAARGRVFRQLMTETIVLFALGGGAGVVLARVLTGAVVPLLPSLPFPVNVALPLDGRVVAFTPGVSLVTAVVFGLTPALQASRVDVITALKDGS